MKFSGDFFCIYMDKEQIFFCMFGPLSLSINQLHIFCIIFETFSSSVLFFTVDSLFIVP